MPATVDIRATGIKEALRELNDIDKRLRRQITKDYEQIVQPIVSGARSLVPTKAPLSGFDRFWTPMGSRTPVLPFGLNDVDGPKRPRSDWAQSSAGRRQMGEWNKWKAGIRAYVSGKRPQTFGGYTRNLAAFGVRWLGKSAVLFDTSAQPTTRQGAQMVSALTSKFGPPSRVMWRAYEKADSQVMYELEKLVKKVMQAVGRKI